MCEKRPRKSSNYIFSHVYIIAFLYVGNDQYMLTCNKCGNCEVKKDNRKIGDRCGNLYFMRENPCDGKLISLAPININECRKQTILHMEEVYKASPVNLTWHHEQIFIASGRNLWARIIKDTLGIYMLIVDARNCIPGITVLGEVID